MSASTFLTLGKNDFVKGAIVAVIGAVFGAVYSILKNSGFDVFSIDWSLTLQASVNVGRPNRCFAVGRFFGLKMPKPSFRCRVVPYFQ